MLTKEQAEKLYNDVAKRCMESPFYTKSDMEVNFTRFHKNFFYYKGGIYEGFTNRYIKIDITIRYLNEDYGTEMLPDIMLPAKFSDLIEMYNNVKIIDEYHNEFWEQDLYHY